jgi:hypothetical protein
MNLRARLCLPLTHLVGRAQTCARFIKPVFWLGGLMDYLYIRLSRLHTGFYRRHLILFNT